MSDSRLQELIRGDDFVVFNLAKILGGLTCVLYKMDRPSVRAWSINNCLFYLLGSVYRWWTRPELADTTTYSPSKILTDFYISNMRMYIGYHKSDTSRMNSQ